MTPQTMVVEDGSRITVVHLAVPQDEDGLTVGTTWRLACAPKMDDLTANGRTAPLQRSDDPRCVSCPLCKVTEQFKATTAKLQAMRKKR